MKKIVCVLLLCGMLTAFLQGCGKTPTEVAGSSDSASEWVESPVEDFEYAENEDGGITITKYIGKDADVAIPEKIDGKPVTQIGRQAFTMASNLVSVKIPSGVTYIGASAFSYRLYLKKVELPNTLKVLGAGVFENCTDLESITLPESLTELGMDAFKECSSLKFIRIPKNIKTWGNFVFYDSGIESVEFEEGLETIGGGAFNWTKLKSVTLPKSIRTVEVAAFRSCFALANVTLNEGLVTIQEGAFEETPINELVIPASVETVTDSSFSKCYFLRTLKFEGDAPADFCEVTSDFTSDEIEEHFDCVHGYFTIYYHEGAKGFNPSIWGAWEGYSVKRW